MKTVIFLLLFLLPISLLAQPPRCGEMPKMTSFCGDACIICDIDGFSGRHESTIVGESPAQFAGECTDIAHNIQWIAFIAGSTNLKVSLTVVECNLGRGLEFGLYRGRNCGNFVRVSTCLGGSLNAIPPGNVGVIENTQPLVIGEYYFIVMDGAGGDNCNWQLDVLEGDTKLAPLETSGVIIGDTLVCPFTQKTYEVEPPVGATEFRWTLNGRVLNRDESAPFTTVDLGAPGEYNLCVTAFNACHTAPTTCKKIIVPAVPLTNINEKICAGDIFEIGDTLLNRAGAYEFRFQTTIGCDSLINLNLEVIDAPITDLGRINICEGDSLPIGGASYFTAGFQEETFSNIAGCDSTLLFDLFLVQCDIQGSISTKNISCAGLSDGMLTFAINNGTPPFTYQVNNLITEFSETGNLTALNENLTFSDLSTGVYLVMVNDEFGNQTILIEEINPPIPLVATFQISAYNGFDISCYNGNDGSIEIIPQGGTPPFTYFWEGNIMDKTRSNLTTGIYEITVEDSRNCIFTDSIYLDQPNPMNFGLIAEVPDCERLNSGAITVSAITGGVSPYFYSLNGDAPTSTSIFDNLGQGAYDFLITDANGCSVSEKITLNAPIIPRIELGEDLLVQLGAATPIIPILAEGVFTVNWRRDSSLSCQDCLTPMLMPINRSTYSVTVASEDNCIATDSITVDVLKVRNIYAPNIFSPNGDGINDKFYLHAGPEVKNIQSFQVFTRWGEKVFDLKNSRPNDSAVSWDGEFQHQHLDGGVYLWQAVIEFIDGEVLVQAGNITLVR